MKRSQPEFRLHCVVADYLRATLSPDVLWFHIPNGEHRSKITGARLKRMGVRAGVADLMIAWRGPFGQHWQAEVLWIELKAAKGRPRLAQAQFQVDTHVVGHHYHVCHSLEEVEQVLRHYEVPSRGRLAA